MFFAFTSLRNPLSSAIAVTFRPALLLLVLVLCSCSAPPAFTLMDTPAIYHHGAIDPFAHLDKSDHGTVLPVFYATNRKPQPADAKHLPYGNSKASELYLGAATLRFGDEEFSWEELYAASLAPERSDPVTLSLAAFNEMARLPETFSADLGQPLSTEQQAFAEAINAQLAKARDKEILVYVHGTKVDFLNAVAMTAEIDHFSGRDFVGVAFAWPSHQNILYYLLGMDVTRARDSSLALQALLQFLAVHTTAEHINLLSYSAGGRVASKAMHELRSRYAERDRAALQRTFRLGAAVFAAADVPLKDFHDRLPSICDLAEQVVVTVSDHDPALLAAEKYMGGGIRIGVEEAEEDELALARALGIDNFEVVDLSLNQKGRGFDIVGHHYWYRHPWASSDIVLLLRTNLPPHRRGLNPAELEGVFYMSPDYPRQVREAVREELGESWLNREKSAP